MIDALSLAGQWLAGQAPAVHVALAGSISFITGVLVSYAFMSTYCRKRMAAVKQQQEAELSYRDNLMQVKLEQQELRSREKLNLLHDAREQMRLQFQELASEILEEKSRNFGLKSEEKLATLLGPFGQQLASFKEKIDSVHHNDTRDRAALQQEISGLKDLNLRMSEEALRLSRALKGDKRLQGTWGELVLARVLEQSGLRQGVEYDTQLTFRDKNSRKLRPDVVVNLPEGRHIVIDSKVSLVAWEQLVNCDDEKRQVEYLESHTKALRRHVTTLADKDYSSLPALRSLDFVLMFMPVEAAFSAAFQHDENLFVEAVSRKIIIVSPTTLLSTLRTVESIWTYEKQSRNAEEIGERAAALYDKFCSFGEDMERIGKQINNLQNSYESAMTRLSRGRGNLVSRVESFPQMGVKSNKKIPISLQNPSGPE